MPTPASSLSRWQTFEFSPNEVASMITVMSLVALVMLFIFFVGVLRLLEVYRDLPKVDFYNRSPELKKEPLVSIIIPARNEEENIGRCLGSVLSQTYRRMEVILVNDQSTDRTGDIAESLAAQDTRLRIISGDSIPQGYSGMVYACAQGSSVASGDYYLFLDADTELIPGGIERALGYALEHQTDLLAAIPKAMIDNFWEALIQPLMGQLFLFQFNSAALNNPEDPTATAWGGFLLFRREAYARVGGHAAMRGALNHGPLSAVLIKQNRMRLGYVLGTNIVIAWMNRGFRTVWNGWTRCIVLGLGRSIPRGLLAMLGLLVFMVVPWVLSLGAFYKLLVQRGSFFHLEIGLLWASVVMASLWHGLIIQRLFDTKTRHVWLQPLSALLIVGIIGNFIWKSLSGREVTWSGRAYPTTGGVGSRPAGPG